MTGVFQNRKTIVTLDEYMPGTLQPWVAIQRQHEQMVRSAQAVVENVGHIPGIGWRLRSYQTQYQDVQELDAAQAGIYSSANGTLAPGRAEYEMYGQTGLTGVTYDARVQTSGSYGHQKRIAAGDSWDQGIPADYAAFPPPFPSEDNVNVSRVYVSSEDHKPGDSLIFGFTIPASVTGSSATAVTCYFGGPASSDKAANATPPVPGKLGLGQYALKLRGDGGALLYERLADSTWIKRFAFIYCDQATLGGAAIHGAIGIHSDCQDASGSYQGNRLAFVCTSSYGETLNGSFAEVINNIIKRKEPPHFIYNVPRLTQQPATTTKMRLDEAADCRPILQVAKHVYPDEGLLFDDYLSFDAPITVDVPVSVCWQGIVPSDSLWSIEVFDGNGVSLSPASAQDNPVPGFYVQTFTPTDQMRYMRVKITFLASTDKFHSPTLTNYGIYRSPVWTNENPLTPYECPSRDAPPAMPRTVISALSINPQAADPNGESASLTINDFVGDLIAIEQRSMVPVKIETEYNLAGDRAVIFRGYALQAESNPRRVGLTRTFPSRNWREYNLQCVGEGARLMEAIVPRRIKWAELLNTPTPKITDIIYLLLGTVVPVDMLDIPDSSIVLYSTDTDAYVSEAGTRILDFVNTLADEFLGAYLLFDEAAGDMGMWRLLPQKTAPYRNLAIFESNKPSGLVLPHVSDAYGTTTVDGQEIIHTYIRANTYRSRVERAEGNLVLVIGSSYGEDASKSGATDAGLLTQFAIKTDSYNFLHLSPGDPGYPDGTSPEFMNRIVPIRAMNYNLTNQDAVNWFVRRLFDRTCYARRVLSFEAPMVLITDTSDAFQRTPRRLRYYDPVQVRNPDNSLAQYLVVSCTPTYRKDHIQMANYVLVTQSNISTVAVMPNRYGAFQMAMKTYARVNGTSFSTPPQTTGQRAANNITSELMGLPETATEALQYLDPNEANFGEFKWMMDYDALG